MNVSDHVIATASDILERVRKGALVSYAQNYEDVMLNRVFSGQSLGFYIDVGAFHTSHNSVTKALYDAGWHGINIDPNPSLMDAFDTERPRDENIVAAISDKAAEAEIFLSEGRGWSTMNTDLAAVYATNELPLKASKINTITLESVFQRVEGATVDFLKVDVEGHENEVIMGNDWSKYRPRVVLVESVVPEILQPVLSNDKSEEWTKWEQQLIDSAYKFAYFDGLNSFYVREEDEALCAAFSRPPNFFDDFLRVREVELASAVIALTDEQ